MERPIVRGKDKAKTEFGTKINISEVNGSCRIDRFSWDAYNESTDVKMQVENFKQTYGCYPRVFLGDQIFLTRENRKYLKEKGIKIYGKPVVRQTKNDSQTASQKYRDKKEAAIKSLLRLELFDKNLLLIPTSNSCGTQKISRP